MTHEIPEDAPQTSVEPDDNGEADSTREILDKAASGREPGASKASRLIDCPTCGARQPLAESCRRCRTDLSLVVALIEDNERLRRRCLALIRQRRLLLATNLASECWKRSASPENARLLTACHLLRGDFKAASTLVASRSQQSHQAPDEAHS